MRNGTHSPAPDKQSLRDAVRMHEFAIDAYVDDNESVPPWLHASLMVCQRALKERERAASGSEDESIPSPEEHAKQLGGIVRRAERNARREQR